MTWRLLLPLLVACGAPDAPKAPLVDSDTDVSTTEDPGSEPVLPDPPDDSAAPSVLITADGTGAYPDIAAALAAGETHLLLAPGDYYIDEALEITTPGTTLRGVDRSTSRIIATRNDQDLVISRADGTTVDNLTLDTELYGAAAFVQAGSHNTTLSNCTILGNDRIFTVFFAGPVVTAGEATLDAWATDTLSTGNAMVGNDIRSAFVGDSVVFALQADGVVEHNTVRNGMLALYMTRRVMVQNNLILNSPTHSLFLSLPSTQTTLSNNDLRSSRYSAISVRPQLEHPMKGRGFLATDIVIANNQIESEYTGIEIDGDKGDPTAVQLVAPTLTGNTIALDDFMGIYIIRTVAPAIIDNTITFFGSDVSRRGVDGRANIASSLSSGIALVLGVQDAVVTENTITRALGATDERVMQNAIRLELDSVTNARIQNNAFVRYTDDWYHAPCSTEGGPADRDGIYDTTQGTHDVANNTCSVAL